MKADQDKVDKKKSTEIEEHFESIGSESDDQDYSDTRA